MVDRTGILPSSPLILTLASVRFAPWTLLSKKIDEIHDELRDILPLLQSVQFQTIVLNGQTQGETPPAIWILMSGDKRMAVQLSQDQILLVSRHYTRFSELAKTIDRILKALMSRMKFMHVTNLGMRYVDHIKAGTDENLGHYLDQRLLPPKFEGLDPLGGGTAASYRAAGKELRVRCNAQPGELSIPEDIAASLALMQQPGRQLEVSPLKNNEALLDMDAIELYEEPLRMDSEREIHEKLKGLHEIANAFFRRKDTLTDHAFEIWKKENKA